MEENNNNIDYTFEQKDKVYVGIALLGAVLGFIPPLIIYLSYKDQLSPGAVYHIKKMLNFQILILCFAAFLFVLNIVPIFGALICALACPFLLVFNLIVSVIASVRAFDFKPFNYPINHDFI